MNVKQVFIVEDEKNTLALLSMVITNHPRLELLTAQGSLADARVALQHHVAPDIFLVDLGLPDGSGIEFIRDIRKHDSDVAIMVLSVFGDERHVVDAISHGAGGYIHKDEDLEEIGRHIEEVLSGDNPISPSIAKHILKRMKLVPNAVQKEHTVLSERELDVLRILARGFKRHEIAIHLQISPHTITTHIKNIYRKLNVHSCTEALFEASCLGLIEARD